ncbi:SDR family oxidoreductase [Rhodococcus sp. NPDC057014]|uniref:SDR family oxidoreductase n=1 Tax=Rhodococcus sp. NPDC057014 TaxID=3346000 RepID=UPI0036421EBD
MTPGPVDLLPPELLRGHTAFVTGGGSGINLGIARAFARTGANVAICGRSELKLQAAAEELTRLGARVSYSQADVRDPDAVNAALQRTADELAPVSIVVAGAAGNFFAPAETLSPKGFRTVIEIDLLGSFHTAHAAFEQLRETRGSLLFISAGQAYLPFALQAHVGAAKAGVENLMRNLALEWGRFGIRANSLVPGPIEGTEGMKRLAGPVGEQVWTEAIPLGRFGSVDEMAAMAAVLSSPLASFVTGAQIVVDGGLGLSGLGSLSLAVAEATSDVGTV